MNLVQAAAGALPLMPAATRSCNHAQRWGLAIDRSNLARVLRGHRAFGDAPFR